MESPFNRANVEITANYAGVLIRNAFLVTGTLMFVAVGLFATSIWSRLPPAPSKLPSQPAFQFAVSTLSQRPQTRMATEQPAAWLETLQYGQLYDRDVDMTAVLIAPRAPYQNLTRDFTAEIAQLRPINGAIYPYPRTYYDLETRFGPVRAAEFSINADGRTKLCLAYLSRFDSPSFYLKGWYCEANGARASYSELACVLDKLTLQHPFPLPEATDFIEERMTRAAKCTAEPVSQTTDTSPRQPLRRLVP
jgi:hypothetical protein